MSYEMTWRFDFFSLGLPKKRKIDAAIDEVLAKHEGVEVEEVGEEEDVNESLTYRFFFPPKEGGEEPRGEKEGEFDFFADEEFGAYLIVTPGTADNREIWDDIVALAREVAEKMGGVEEAAEEEEEAR